MTNGCPPTFAQQFDPGRETLSNVGLVRRISSVRNEFDARVARLTYDPEWKQRIAAFGDAVMSGSLRTLQNQVQSYRDSADSLRFIVDVLNAIFPSDEITFELGYVPSAAPTNKHRPIPVLGLLHERNERMLAIGSEDWYGVCVFAVQHFPVQRREAVDDNVKQVYRHILAAIEPSDPGPPPFLA